MRIGLSTSVVQRGKTGVAQYVFALLRAMRAYSHQHDFVLFVLEEDLPLFEFVRDQMEIVSVPETFRPPIKNILWHQNRLPSLAWQHHLDVLHVPSYRRLLWPKPCRLVGTIHDLAPFRVPKKYDWKRMLYGRIIVRRLAHRQDGLIAVSDSTANDLRTFFRLPADRISVIPNGIDHDRFSPGDKVSPQSGIAQRAQLPQPFFLYVARIEHPGKNHIRLISAFEEFKAATHSPWQLVFGGSDWHGADVVHKRIQDSPFGKDIRCLGFVSDDDLPDLYRAASVFVYPSLYEGFGFPPLEAMACACPVICSTRGALAEVIGDAAAKVDPEDIHTIARELYIVATDEACRNRLRAAGLAQARKFDWKRTADETIKVYAKVVQ
jgi:glycosyltransferase involved in cell wall biosynthesis